MDEIILFQSFMDAFGVTLNAKKYADNSTYTVTKQDVNRWWDRQTDAFKKSWNFLALPAKLMLWLFGEEEFRSKFLPKLREGLDYSLEKQISENEFLNDYANSLSSAQQNSITYGDKNAYNISSKILDSTKIIRDAVLNSIDSAGNQEVIDITVDSVKSYIKDTLKFDWKIDEANLRYSLKLFLEKYPAYRDSYNKGHKVKFHIIALTSPENSVEISKRKYVSIAFAISSGLSGNQIKLLDYKAVKPIAGSSYRIQIYPTVLLSSSVSIGTAESVTDRNVFPTLLDASILKNTTERRNYYCAYANSSKLTLFNRTLSHDYNSALQGNETVVSGGYDVDSNSDISIDAIVEGSGSTAIYHSLIGSVISTIDRFTYEKIDERIIYKDVISTDQTLIGITSDSTDDADERTFLMNAESVEELANTKAVDYPEVLPKTIAGSIVGIGTDVKSAVDTIRDNNPEYPYIPETPISDTTGNSLFTLYNVTTSELSSLADYLWSTDFIDSFKKFFSEPSDSLISLVAYPVDVKNAGAKNIKIGYSDSGVSSHVITDYIQEFDLGSITIPPAYNNFLDNNPYTKVHIYLPFIGSCPLDADLVVGSTLRIKYRVELLTGNCMALITVSSINGTYPVYQFNGNLGMQFPLSSGSYASIYKNLITTGITTAGAIASGGALTPLAVASVANTVINSKANVSRSGNVSGSVGYCGIMKPYVLVERPVTDIPTDYAKYNGVVTNRTLAIGSLHGYCVMDNVDVSTVPCTESERDEIIKLLMSGFYI